MFEIVSAAATPDGTGAWMTTAAGEVFPVGTAAYHGSPLEGELEAPVISILPTPGGRGYLLVTAAGEFARFGDARPKTRVQVEG